jgi:hypothetical protein
MEIFRIFWHYWKQLGKFIGDQIARVILTIFYFTLFVPFALGLRIWGDPLALRPHHRSEWLERKTSDLTIKDSRRLF